MNFNVKFLSFYLSLFLTTPCLAGADLSSYTAPSDMKNLHIDELSSGDSSSEFIIFVRNEVKSHFHKEHTELIYVLEGEGLFLLDDTKQIIKPGDFIRVNKGVVHSVKVTSKIPLKVLSIQTPKFIGKDRYFVE
ncbi:cupin domain-containing protein [Colwellia sp. 1_MG-2023]|uniref:cupin domain-containing protein n=1 Tax=Colwellia sp. 1_MG-2023 TaxID=3062649 RepID=UPI0026E1DE6F|nr:cupin domain-containing protein [Colwellia sp. 1_MG-2023]